MDLFNLFAPEAEVLDPSWDRISIDQIGPTDFPDYPEMDVEGETGSAPTMREDSTSFRRKSIRRLTKIGRHSFSSHMKSHPNLCQWKAKRPTT